MACLCHAYVVPVSFRHKPLEHLFDRGAYVMPMPCLCHAYVLFDRGAYTVQADPMLCCGWLELAEEQRHAALALGYSSISWSDDKACTVLCHTVLFLYLME